ncbi:MAG: hypothetical protein AAGA85_28200 [Bacteroidota bacterium]
MKKVGIPEKMQKFYGFGTMLHPDEEMVGAMIGQIPEGKVATINSLCERLAMDHDTNVTCPMRTSNIVKAMMQIAGDASASIPSWRVIRKNHLLINSPVTAQCAEKLQKEGIQVHQNSKGEFKVQGASDRLFIFP